MGICPTVHDSALNPNYQLHGGGEGSQPIFYDAPRTSEGKRHIGIKTRKQTKDFNA